MGAISYVGFGTLEELVDDLKQDGADYVRVDTVRITTSFGQHGIKIDDLGVTVAARMDDEIRYAWVLAGRQQMLGKQPMSGRDAGDLTMHLYDAITQWLREQGLCVRSGSFSFPKDIRTMTATTELRAKARKEMVRMRNVQSDVKVQV